MQFMVYYEIDGTATASKLVEAENREAAGDVIRYANHGVNIEIIRVAPLK